MKGKDRIVFGNIHQIYDWHKEWVSVPLNLNNLSHFFGAPRVSWWFSFVSRPPWLFVSCLCVCMYVCMCVCVCVFGCMTVPAWPSPLRVTQLFPGRAGEMCGWSRQPGPALHQTCESTDQWVWMRSFFFFFLVSLRVSSLAEGCRSELWLRVQPWPPPLSRCVFVLQISCLQVQLRNKRFCNQVWLKSSQSRQSVLKMLRRDPAVCENELELQISELHKKYSPPPRGVSYVVVSHWTLNYLMPKWEQMSTTRSKGETNTKHKITAELKDTDSETDQCCKTWKKLQGWWILCVGAVHISISI